MVESKFKIGDRVIYDGCPCLINSSTNWVGTSVYRLDPIFWDKGYKYLDTWIEEVFIELDYQYLRNIKLESLGL